MKYEEKCMQMYWISSSIKAMAFSYLSFFSSGDAQNFANWAKMIFLHVEFLKEDWILVSSDSRDDFLQNSMDKSSQKNSAGF